MPNFPLAELTAISASACGTKFKDRRLL